MSTDGCKATVHKKINVQVKNTAQLVVRLLMQLFHRHFEQHSGIDLATQVTWGLQACTLWTTDIPHDERY